MLELVRDRKIRVSIVLFLGISLLLTVTPRTVAEADADCKDVAIVFLRGSGQNNEHLYLNSPFDNQTFGKVEPESYSFFNWFKYHLESEYPHVDYKAVTIHDFPGKYDPIGYKAERVGPSATDLQRDINSIEADASWFPGNYQSSVEHGINETVGYLKDQIASCPDQSIVVGGYSQGAQVMGESLFRLTDHERSKILGVGLFGDPKFIASTGDNLLNPLDHAVSYPWRRGDATNNDRGMLDARMPYVPSDTERKTASYCYRSDLVCAGWSGVRGLKDMAHKGYADEPMRNTVNEMMQWATPHLLLYEKARGGNVIVDDDTLRGMQPDTNDRDIMFLVNDDAGLSIIQTLRYDLDQVLKGITFLHPSVKYAAKGYEERQSGTTYRPSLNNIQSFTSYMLHDLAQPAGASNIGYEFAKHYPFGQPYYGDGDLPDPHGLAVERAAMSPGWEENAEKHIVLFTERPLHKTYSYNICDSTTRNLLLVPSVDYNPCKENIGLDVWPKSQHPEFCETVYLLVTQDTCTNPIKSPGSTQMINRTLDDAITVAQTQKIAVDVVLAKNIRFKYNTQAAYDTDIQDLKYLAEATGGKFIYYDKATDYTPTLFADTMYQVFGHTPKPLVLAYKDAINNDFSNSSVLGTSTDQAVILDVSRSGQSFGTYKWDFDNDGQWDETSPGPVIEHQFTSPTNGFMKVAGIDDLGTVQSQTRLALTVTESQQAVPEPISPTAPDVTGSTDQNGDITLTWQPAEEGILFVIDPESKLPIASVDASVGSVTFIPEKPYSELQIRLMTDEATSEVQTITIEPYIAPPANTEEQANPDPTICYKLQQCQDESDFQESFSPQPQSKTVTFNEPSYVQNISVIPSTSQPTIVEGIKQQPAVQGTSTNPTLLKETDEINPQPTKPTNTNQLTRWFIVIVLILGGAALVYRLSMRKLQLFI